MFSCYLLLLLFNNYLIVYKIIIVKKGCYYLIGNKNVLISKI